MNKQYFYILGNNPELSIAEIISQLQIKQIDYTVDLAISSVLIISAPDLDNAFFNSLGGSKKFGEIKQKLSSLDKLSLEDLEIGEDKFRFGFSLYNFSKSELKKNIPVLRRMGLTFKKELRAKGVKSRLVESKEDELSSVIVHKEKMVESGADIVLIKYKEEIFYGRTSAVQDYDSFSKRDYGKPGRDSTSGMLPPKLARIMLNLTGKDSSDIILDPFCGSGTVILEALALGYTNILGSDKSEVAVEDSSRNLIWWQQHHVLNNIPEVKRVRVEELSNFYDNDSVDAIVTEPYLGPPLRGKESPAQIISMQKQLQELYSVTLTQFNKVLKPGGIIVMVWPVFVDKKDNRLYLNLKDKVESLNLEFKDYLKNIDLSIERLTAHRKTYYYYRVGQRVGREIVILEKKN
ncbi:MAG: TRM11 family SAM-dependent methyltransferase [Candidatus Komeilibacteria bacterium]